MVEPSTHERTGGALRVFTTRPDTPFGMTFAVLAPEETVTMVVQVNGKLSDRLEVDPSIGAEEARSVALALPRVVAALDGKEPRRVIVKPPRLVNVVV